MKPVSELTEEIAERWVRKYTDYKNVEEMVFERRRLADEYVQGRFPGCHCDAPVVDILRAQEQESICPDPDCPSVRNCPYDGWIVQLCKVGGEVKTRHDKCEVWIYRRRPRVEETEVPAKPSGFRKPRKDTDE